MKKLAYILSIVLCISCRNETTQNEKAEIVNAQVAIKKEQDSVQNALENLERHAVVAILDTGATSYPDTSGKYAGIEVQKENNRSAKLQQLLERSDVLQRKFDSLELELKKY